MAALMADRQLSVVQGKLKATCDTGLKILRGQGGTNVTELLGASTCGASLMLQGVRSYVQVVYALFGGAMQPVEAAASELMKSVMDGVDCLANPFGGWQIDEDEHPCKQFYLSPIRIILAGKKGALEGADYAYQSTADAIGDVVSSIGLDGEEVEKVLKDVKNFAVTYTGLNFAADTLLDVEQYEKSLLKPVEISDDTLQMRIPLTPMQIKLGKNTNVCVGENKCVDDLVDLAKRGVEGAVKGIGSIF